MVETTIETQSKYKIPKVMPGSEASSAVTTSHRSDLSSHQAQAALLVNLKAHHVTWTTGRGNKEAKVWHGIPVEGASGLGTTISEEMIGWLNLLDEDELVRHLS